MICVLLLVMYLLELVRNRLLKAGGFKPAFCLNSLNSQQSILLNQLLIKIVGRLIVDIFVNVL